MEELRLMGIAEIAKFFGMSQRSRASDLYRTNKQFPAPVAVLRCGPIFLAEDVENFGRTWERRRGPKTRKAKETQEKKEKGT